MRNRNTSHSLSVSTRTTGAGWSSWIPTRSAWCSCCASGPTRTATANPSLPRRYWNLWRVKSRCQAPVLRFQLVQEYLTLLVGRAHHRQRELQDLAASLPREHRLGVVPDGVDEVVGRVVERVAPVLPHVVVLRYLAVLVEDHRRYAEHVGRPLRAPDHALLPGDLHALVDGVVLAGDVQVLAHHLVTDAEDVSVAGVAPGDHRRRVYLRPREHLAGADPGEHLLNLPQQIDRDRPLVVAVVEQAGASTAHLLHHAPGPRLERDLPAARGHAHVHLDPDADGVAYLAGLQQRFRAEVGRVEDEVLEDFELGARRLSRRYHVVHLLQRYRGRLLEAHVFAGPEGV